MKFSFLTILLFVTGIVNATNYYVDGSTTLTTQNGSLSSPWKTLSQVSSNMSSFLPGDIISFKKGGTYPGQLNINRSGTAGNPITFNAYGTGNAPIFSGTGSRITYLIYVFSRSYITFDGINVTDPGLSPTDRSQQSNIERAFFLDGSSTNLIVKNCSISLVGVGFFLAAGGNTIENCTVENLRMIVNTNNGGYDDYGANAVVIDKDNNNIKNNIFRGCWANSYDFTYDGGAIEFNGPEASNNKIMYNTIADCNGVMEMGSNSTIGIQTGNVIAYNKMINNGSLMYINNTGPFAVNVSNLQFYNNVIVETLVGRLNDSYLAGMASASANTGIVVMKNNIFWLTNGVDVARSSQLNSGQLTHEDNIYRLGTGSALNFTLHTTELSTSSTNIFSSSATNDPISWNYAPSGTSPAIDFGQNVGIPKDFAGNPVPATPNSGILETAAAGLPVPVITATAGTITCNGGTAIVTVTGSGGTAPYTGTGSFTVGAGSYTYVITDANAVTASSTINVTQPAAVNANIASGTIAAFGGRTTLTITASGGTGAYLYKLNSGAYQASNIFSNVAAGNHTITVKDANNCSYAKSIILTQPASASMLVTATSGSISCNAGTTTVTVNASGGTAPYTGTGSFTVAAGTYTYSVSDATYSVKSTTITVSQPAALVATTTNGTINIYGGTTSLTASASGGTGPYTYKLNSGNYQSSGSFNNVAAGNHTITAKDSKGCTVVKSITITQPVNNTLAITSTAGTILCNGGTTTVTVAATGGTMPYTGTGAFTVSAGTYTYTVTDAGGVTRTSSVTISQPSALSITLTSGTITTYGGLTTITATVTGGTGAYTYKKNSGSFQSTGVFGNITAGTYTIMVMDANGCTSLKNITVTQPAQSPLQAAAASGTIACNAGTTTVTVTASGGTSPYTGTGTFTVTAGTYSYTVQDAAGATKSTSITVTQPTAVNVTLSSGTISTYGGTTSLTAVASGGTTGYTYKLNSGSYQASNIFTGLSAGTYAVTVKDSKGCTATKSISITQPTQGALIAASTAGVINCNGGTTNVTVTASGGTAPYTGTGTFTVSAGTYSYTVRDAAGTTKSTSITVSQPSALSASLSAGNITTYGGSTTVSVTASGGTGPYTYKINSGNYQSSNQFSSIPAGSHTVTIRDAKNCTSVKTIVISQPLQILLVSSTNNTCKFRWDGTITVGAGGGVAPYTYQIASYGFGVTSTFINLAPGTFTLYAKDANGTVSTMQVTILASNVTCTNKSNIAGRVVEPVKASPILENIFTITAFPNPSTDVFYVHIINGDLSKVDIAVINTDGRMVERIHSPVNAKVQLGKQLPAGTYFIRVKQGDKIKTATIIKSN